MKKEAIKNPYSNDTVAEVYFAEETDLEDAIASSQKAFEITKRLPAYKRAEILKNIVQGLEQRREELAKTITLEAGKPITDSRSEVNGLLPKAFLSAKILLTTQSNHAIALKSVNKFFFYPSLNYFHARFNCA